MVASAFGLLSISGSVLEKGPNQIPPIMMSVGTIAPEPPLRAAATGAGAGASWAESCLRRLRWLGADVDIACAVDLLAATGMLQKAFLAAFGLKNREIALGPPAVCRSTQLAASPAARNHFKLITNTITVKGR